MTTARYIGLLTLPAEVGLTLLLYKAIQAKDPALGYSEYGFPLFARVGVTLGVISLAVLVLGLFLAWREYKAKGSLLSFWLCLAGAGWVLVQLMVLSRWLG